MAKVMKWVPVLLGIVCLLLGFVALMVKMEDETTKSNMLLFAAFGLFGLCCMVFGFGFSALFETVGRIDDKTSTLEDEDIPPGA